MAETYRNVHLKGIYFPSRGRAVATIIPALAKGAMRFPVYETLMKKIENVEIRNVKVFIESAVGETSFDIYFRYDNAFDTNASVKAMWQDIEWPGDILILQNGTMSEYINISSPAERRKAHKAVEIFLRHSQDQILEAAVTGENIAIFSKELRHVEEEEEGD